MGRRPEQVAAEILLDTVVDRHRDHQRSDAGSNANDRESGDERDETLAALGP